MPKVTTKIARKEYKCSLTGAIINPGDTYYEFTPYKQRAKKCIRYPKRSEMTGSSKLASLYNIQEQIESYEPNMDSDDPLQDAKDWVEGLVSEIESVRDEYQESLDNMPDSLQSSSTGDAIQEKIDACEAWADTVTDCLENVELENKPEGNFNEDAMDEWRESSSDLITQALSEAASQLEL